MYDVFRAIVFAIGGVQGLFLAFALLLKQTANRRATRTLAALVAVFAALILGELVEVLASSPGVRWITFVTVNLELAIGPLLLLFVRYVFDPERSFKASDAAQLLPLAAGVSAWLALYVHLRSRQEVPDLGPFRTLIVVYVVFKASFFYTYWTWTLLTLRRELARTARLTAGRQNVRLGWLRRWFLAFGALATLLYGLFFVNAYDRVVPLDSDDFASFILAVMIYLVSLMVLLRPWVLSVRPRRQQGERHAADARRLEEWLERERPYLDPDLTLRDLADALGLAENRISAVINEGLGTTFYDLVSGHRLTHFERLARDGARRDRTVLDLAFESGFNSKASFYRYFRRVHGTTPTAFRESLRGST